MASSSHKYFNANIYDSDYDGTSSNIDDMVTDVTAYDSINLPLTDYASYINYNKYASAVIGQAPLTQNITNDDGTFTDEPYFVSMSGTDLFKILDKVANYATYSRAGLIRPSLLVQGSSYPNYLETFVTTGGDTLGPHMKVRYPAKKSGSILYANGTSGAPSELGIGTSGQILMSNGSVPYWGTMSSGSLPYTYHRYYGAIGGSTKTTYRLIYQFKSMDGQMLHIQGRIGGWQNNNSAWIDLTVKTWTGSGTQVTCGGTLVPLCDRDCYYKADNSICYTNDTSRNYILSSSKDQCSILISRTNDTLYNVYLRFPGSSTNCIYATWDLLAWSTIISDGGDQSNYETWYPNDTSDLSGYSGGLYYGTFFQTFGHVFNGLVSRYGVLNVTSSNTWQNLQTLTFNGANTPAIITVTGRAVVAYGAISLSYNSTSSSSYTTSLSSSISDYRMGTASSQESYYGNSVLNVTGFVPKIEKQTSYKVYVYCRNINYAYVYVMY